MGILNVTPDSFSDGAQHAEIAAAVQRAIRMRDEGADIIDVGGESTRPGAHPVTATEERARILPVIARLADELPGVPLSIDTTKADVASAALDAGAAIVNDVSGLRLDGSMARVCADSGAGVVIMHSRGTVADMATYAHAVYGNVVTEVIDELRSRLGQAEESGVDPGNIVLDPGIGFAKRTADSLELLAGLDRLGGLGFPVLVGVSRKRFIGELTGIQVAAERVMGTVGVNVMALDRGARIFRVHDVAPNRQALDAAWGVLGAANRVSLPA